MPNNISYCKTKTFIPALAMALGLGLPIQALGGAGLKAVAEANNRQYREVKALGNSATSAKVAEINKRVFGPALKQLRQERAQTFNQWRQVMRASNKESKEEIARILGQDKDGKQIASGKGEAKPPVTGNRPVTSSAPAHTGTSEGAAGAKDVTFGGASKKPTPKVNEDGIIVE
jgi:hypothetical protein